MSLGVVSGVRGSAECVVCVSGAGESSGKSVCSTS
jgi:hypothetical protein